MNTKMTPKAKVAVQIYNAAKGFETICAITGDKFFPGLKCRYSTVDEFLNAGEFKQYSVSELEYKLHQLELAKENGTKKYKEIILLQTEEGKAAKEYKEEQEKKSYEKYVERCETLKNELNEKLAETFGEGVGVTNVSDYNIEIGILEEATNKTTGEKFLRHKFGHSFTAYLRDDFDGTRKNSLEVNFGTMGNFCVKNDDPAKIDTDYIRYISLIGEFCTNDEIKNFVYDTMLKVRAISRITRKVRENAEKEYNDMINNTNVEL